MHNLETVLLMLLRLCLFCGLLGLLEMVLDTITRGPRALMRSHEFNGKSHLFVVKFTLSDPLGVPSCQISYLERFQNDIDTICLIIIG